MCQDCYSKQFLTYEGQIHPIDSLEHWDTNWSPEKKAAFIEKQRMQNNTKGIDPYN